MTLTLSNSGDIPIVVDREMVFLISIEVTSSDGSDVAFEETEVVDPTKTDFRQWRNRFVRLHSGEAIERQVELKKGFRCFVCAVGSSFTPEGMLVHDRVSAYESLHRLPGSVQLHDIQKIVVTYGVYCGFRDAFTQYTGLKPSSLGLFEGPLVATLSNNSNSGQATR